MRTHFQNTGREIFETMLLRIPLGGHVGLGGLGGWTRRWGPGEALASSLSHYTKLYAQPLPSVSCREEPFMQCREEPFVQCRPLRMSFKRAASSR